jgi:hypothetical protein
MRKIVPTASEIRAGREAQPGFALASVLPIMVVLSIFGTMVYRNVHTEIIHSGKDTKRVRAEFAAESAVQWALAELSRPRPGKLPFTMATHQSDGLAPMSGSSTESIIHAYNADPYHHEEEPPARKFNPSDLAEFPDAKMGVDENGWIFKTTTTAESGISGGGRETLAFKVWYPDDTTLCITGKAVVDGSTAQLDLVSDLQEVLVPF